MGCCWKISFALALILSHFKSSDAKKLHMNSSKADFSVDRENSDYRDRGHVLLMFQGCGSKTSLFKLGLRLGQELTSEHYNVTITTIRKPGGSDRAIDDAEGNERFSVIDILSEAVIEECDTLKGKLSAMSPYKAVGTQQLLGLLHSQRIFCEAFLQNQTLMAHLRELHLDMIISESFGPCHVIISHLLGGVKIGNFHVLSPSSLPPVMFLQSMPPTPSASILERFQHTAEAISLRIFYQRLWGWYSNLASDHGISSLRTVSGFASAYGQASLWFLNGDSVLDYPVSLPLNVIFLGDLTSHPSRHIVDNELRETITQFHSKGHVVVSISTIARQLKPTTEETLAEGLERLPYQTLWRNDRPPLVSSGNNVHFTGWMEDNDMNDLLGLNGTVAVITTGGRCGIMEAIYHGVPVLCLPLMSEHHENCGKVHQIGMGVVLDIHSFTADDVYNAVMKLTRDESFQRKARHASSTLKSKTQPPGKRVAFWLGHILQNGDRHLQNVGSGSLWSLLQITCLDLVVQFVTIACISAWFYSKIVQLTSRQFDNSLRN